MPAHKYHDALLDEAARLREAGVSVPGIGRRLGIPESVVSYHCLKVGADSPDAVNRPESARKVMEYSRNDHVVRRFTEEEDALMLRLETEGLPVCEIARRLNRRNNSVIGRLRTLARHEARREARAAQGQDGSVWAAEGGRHG